MLNRPSETVRDGDGSSQEETSNEIADSTDEGSRFVISVTGDICTHFCMNDGIVLPSNKYTP